MIPVSKISTEEQEVGKKKVTIAASIDAVGLYCPMPIILLKKEISIVKSHQVVKILADDCSFEKDLSAWCKLTDNKVLSITKNDEDIFIAYIEKH